MFTQNESFSENSGRLAIPDFFAISNGELQTATHWLSKKAVNSIYGFVQLSYGNWVFLDVTGRNDWSSALPSDNRSYFYSSYGTSFVLTELVKSIPKDWLSYAKFRVSYAKVLIPFYFILIQYKVNLNLTSTRFVFSSMQVYSFFLDEKCSFAKSISCTSSKVPR